MLGVIVHHVANEGREFDGMQLIRTAGRAMKGASGFRHRYTMVSRDDPRKIATVTLWDSHGDFVRWTESEANRAIVRPPGLWAVKPEQLFFDVVAD
jgi:heme-degrading monooxygenase HmoA